MKTWPKELTEQDLQEIADKVRKRMIDQFGNTLVYNFFKDSPMPIELLKATFVAVREQLEKQ